MVSVVGIAYSISMIDRFSRNFTRLINFTEGLSESSRKLTVVQKRASLAIISTAGALDAALALTALRASKVEDALARLETVTRSTTQSVSTSLNNAREAARRFSTEYTAATSETVKAQFELATAGVAVEEQIAAVQASFKLARATVQDFTSATQFMGQLLNTFGQSVQFAFLDPFEKARRITDTLSATVQRFQVTLPVLQEGFKFLVGPATQLGLKLEDVSTALGILNTAGFRGTLAGTALSNVFNKLQRAIDKLDLDPEKFTDAQGNISSLADFFKEVGESIQDLSPIERQLKLIEVFDIRAGRVVPTLINLQGSLRKTAAEISLMNGVTEQMANTVEETTSAQLKKLVNTFDNVAASIGEGVNDSLKFAIGGFKEFTAQLQAFVEANKGLIGGIAVTVATIATLSSVVLIALAGVAALKVVIASVGVISAVAATGIASLVVAVSALAALAAAVFLVPLIASFVDTVGGAIFGIETLAQEQERHAKLVRDVDRQYGSFSSTLQTVAAEYGRLAQASEAGITPVIKDLALGDTALAKFATAQLKAAGAGAKLSDALSKSGLAQFIADNKRIADSVGVSIVEILKLSSAALVARQQFDSTFGTKSPIRQQEIIFKDVSKAGSLAIQSLAGDNEILAKSFFKVSEAQTRAAQIRIGAQKKLDALNKRTAIAQQGIIRGAFSLDVLSDRLIERPAIFREFELATTKTVGAVDALAQASTQLANIEGLSPEALNTLREFAELTAAGKTAVDAFAEFDKSKLQEILDFIANFNKRVVERAQAIQRTSTVSDDYNSSLRELSTALSNISKNQESYDKGITGSQKRTDKFTKNIIAAVVNLNDLEKQIPDIVKELPALEKKLGKDSPFVRGLRQLVDEFPEFKVQVRLDIRESIFREDLTKAIEGIRGSVEGLLPFETKNINKFASDFASAFSNAIKDANAPQNVITQFQNLAKTSIVDTLSQTISQGAVLGLKRLPEQFTKALGAITDARPDILVELRAGNVQRFLEVLNFIKKSLGPIGEQLGIDEFAANMRKAEVSTDGIAKNLAAVQTALTTAGATEGAALRRVAGIIQEGPLQDLSVAQLESQIQRLQPIIQNLVANGINTGLAESALTARFERRNELLQGNLSNQTIGFGGLDKIDGLAEKVKAAALTFPDAGDKFVDRIVGGISRIAQAFTGANISSAVTPTGRAIEIELKGASQTFNIEFNKTVTGGSGNVGGDDALTEGEFKELSARLKELMTRDVDEKLRDLEIRLRGLIK